MTVQIIRLKKFSQSLCVLTLCLLAEKSLADTRLPLLQNVGIIPPQWEGAAPEDLRLRVKVKVLEQKYFKSAKKSARFRFLHDDLVNARWATPEGRAELAEVYELHGFLGLNVILSESTVRFVARLLSPKLDVYLSESEPWSLLKFANASDEDLLDLCENIIFRLLNRLPADMVVTSVQGRYVSLSAGSDQGLRVGDEFSVSRFSIAEVHPADGSWRIFNATKQGKIRIADVRNLTSVGLIIDQSYDGAIGVSDGVKVENIQGRKFFKKTNLPSEFNNATDQAPVVISAKNSKPKKPLTAEVVDKKNPPYYDATSKPEEPASSKEQLTQNQAELSGPQEALEEDQAPVEFTLQKDSRKAVDIILGIDQWSVSGATSSKASFSSWVFNEFGARFLSGSVAGFDLELQGSLKYGSTSDSTYSGLAGAARFVRLLDSAFEGVDHIRFGAEFSVLTLAVNSGSYGGLDLIKLSGFAGLNGRFGLASSTIGYRSDLILTPLAFGQLGYEGSKHSVDGGFGFLVQGELVMVEKSETMNYGVGLELGTFSADAGSSVSLNDLKLLALLRYHL